MKGSAIFYTSGKYKVVSELLFSKLCLALKLDWPVKSMEHSYFLKSQTDKQLCLREDCELDHCYNGIPLQFSSYQIRNKDKPIIVSNVFEIHVEELEAYALQEKPQCTLPSNPGFWSINKEDINCTPEMLNFSQTKCGMGLSIGKHWETAYCQQKIIDIPTLNQCMTEKNIRNIHIVGDSTTRDLFGELRRTVNKDRNKVNINILKKKTSWSIPIALQNGKVYYQYQEGMWTLRPKMVLQPDLSYPSSHIIDLDKFEETSHDILLYSSGMWECAYGSYENFFSDLNKVVSYLVEHTKFKKIFLLPPHATQTTRRLWVADFAAAFNEVFVFFFCFFCCVFIYICFT